MKILWLTNKPLPVISKILNEDAFVKEGWLCNLFDMLSNNHSIELFICTTTRKSTLKGEYDGFRYYIYPSKESEEFKYSANVEECLKEYVDECKPDVIHIWGTEYPQTLSMVRACNRLGLSERVVISIQGMVSVIAKHYYAGIPHKVINSYTFHDLLKRSNIKLVRKQLYERGKYEIESIKTVKHIIGRTDWDYACTKFINSDVLYHHCDEILRESFYINRWNIDRCEKYSIFLSQAETPIKGLHYALEALLMIKKKYPEVHLYIAGSNIVNDKSIIDKMRITGYGRYIRKLIKQFGLGKYITFTGKLDEEAMCNRYLKSHVFICPSAIENSSNSVSEAMILGVPTVSSDVGGIKNLLTHNEDGYIYQYDAPYMLAYYVCKIFSDDKLAIQLSEKANSHAVETHNKELILKKVLEIYNTIAKKN